jgi:tetratricopeptide (TPR) repeat protein
MLADLVAKSLLLCEVDSSGPRYRLLETIRFYALEKLAHSSDVTEVAQRHANFVAAMVETGAREWVTAPTEVWRREHQSEIDDLRAALDWAFSPRGDKRIGLKILANSAPYWIQLSMHDECQRWLTLALATSSSIPPEEELALQVALGTSLSWAKGPVHQTGSVWASACELAVRLNHAEAQLQSRYGLWLFFLRCGEYRQSLAHAAEMMKLAQAVDDAEALAAAQRILGVSRHFLGDHKEARSLIETSLAWYDQGLCSQPFRFGLDQRVSGLAFLSRVLWVQGEFTKAFEVASASIAGARALDHACTMCCALAEGWCTVNALAGDRDAVESGSLMLIKTGAKYGLGFWTAYGEIFRTWAEATGAKQSDDALQRLISLHTDIDLDPGYSSLVGDLLVRASSAASLAQIDVGFLRGRSGEVTWATPEFARIRASLPALLDGPAAEHSLKRALSLAKSSGAHAWEVKIAIDLARLLINEARLDQAREILSAFSTLPDPTGPLAEQARNLMAGCGPG